MTEEQNANTIELATEIVAAYVAHNSVPMADLPALIQNVHGALTKLGDAPQPQEPLPGLKPAVPIKKSITDDYLISLESGKKFKSLKRHLMTTYGMTPHDYRTKWGLPKDYPMVAPAYAKSRSDLARTLGLGRKAGSAEIEEAMAEPVSEPEAPVPEHVAVEAAAPAPEAAPASEKPKRGRKPKQAA